MTEQMYIKITYVEGLEKFAQNELRRNSISGFVKDNETSGVMLYTSDLLRLVKQLRTISHVYIVTRGESFHPKYINNHKSKIGSIISLVQEESVQKFKTYRLDCAGKDSPEISEIKKYIETTFGLTFNDQADMNIHIIKTGNTWEVGVDATVRPLSVRSYRTDNMRGAMDATIAAAMCSLIPQGKNISILNPCSGSGTILVEAKIARGNDIVNAIGFDNDKEHITIWKHTIKKAGFIKDVDIKFLDLYDIPNIGKFDVMVSDLPFGIAIANGEDLSKLYESFFACVHANLKQDGTVLVYTIAQEIFEKISQKYGTIIEKYEFKIASKQGVFLYPALYVWKRNKQL